MIVSQEAPCVSDNFTVLAAEGRSETEVRPPVRPPRRVRKKLKNLSLDGDKSLHEDSHQNDILFRTDSTVKLNKDNNCLKGTIQTLSSINHYITLFIREYFGAYPDYSRAEVSVEAAVGLL